ncbi:MAG: proline--tRNA ligase, partial [Clostridia bacterium]|nr:proline--tRNA ligase [Clostridia bacterium]
EYEMKGVPVRLELGPRDIEGGQCVLVSRHDRAKSFVSLDCLEAEVEKKLGEVRDGLWEKAVKNRENRTRDAFTVEDIGKSLEENGDGFFRAMWCGSEECEKKVKELTGVGSRCIPFEQEKISDKCVCCGKPAGTMLLWAKAY